MEYSCKKFAAQFAKTFERRGFLASIHLEILADTLFTVSEESYGRAQDETAQIGVSGSLGVFSGQILSETYKKTKVSTCGRAGRGEGLTKKQRGTEQLRCKLGGLDPDLVDDLATLGPFPCTLEFRTPCND